jgi:pimeloyl-ACP methyl ester carboxylesterase
MYSGARPVDLASLADIEFAELARAQEAVARYAWKPYFHHPKLLHRLGRVRVPVHLVHGAHDRFVYDADEFYRAYAAAIPDVVRVERVAGAAHRVDEECPARVAEVVREALAHGGS